MIISSIFARASLIIINNVHTPICIINVTQTTLQEISTTEFIIIAVICNKNENIKHVLNNQNCAFSPNTKSTFSVNLPRL